MALKKGDPVRVVSKKSIYYGYTGIVEEINKDEHQPYEVKLYGFANRISFSGVELHRLN